MSSDEQLLDLIKEGNVNDVVQFLDSRHLTGDHFRQHGEAKSHFHRKGFVTTAAACGYVDILDALTLRGFSAEEQHSDGMGSLQPIHVACREGHLCVVKRLLENHKVNVGVYQNIFGLTPLQMIVSEGTRNIYPIVQYLLSRGANLKCVSPLSSFCVDCISNPSATPELLQLLLSNGAEVDDGNWGPPPLHTAVDKGKVEFVEILLDAGADVADAAFEPRYWWECMLRHRRHYPPCRVIELSAFMRASQKNDLLVLKVLYSRGADPDYSNRFGISALHIAAARGFYDIAKYLIVDIGVALDKKDIFGETPFIYAVAKTHTHIVKLILKAGYDPDPEELEFEDSDPIFKKDGVFELLHEVRQMTSVPRTLRELCIFRLRHLLCRDLPNAVESLPLPNTLKNMIRLTHL